MLLLNVYDSSYEHDISILASPLSSRLCGSNIRNLLTKLSPSLLEANTFMLTPKPAWLLHFRGCNISCSIFWAAIKFSSPEHHIKAASFSKSNQLITKTRLLRSNIFFREITKLSQTTILSVLTARYKSYRKHYIRDPLTMFFDNGCDIRQSLAHQQSLFARLVLAREICNILFALVMTITNKSIGLRSDNALLRPSKSNCGVRWDCRSP